MTTALLERPKPDVPTPVAEAKLAEPVGLPASVDWDLDLEDAPAGFRFPWMRLILAGVFAGLLIGLPLAPSGEKVFAAFGEFAAAYGLPCHSGVSSVR